jgi:hypothetical protein
VDRLSIDGDEVRQVVDSVAVSIGVHKAVFTVFDPLGRAPQPVADGNFEVGIMRIELEIFGGPFKRLFIPHEAIAESLHLF